MGQIGRRLLQVIPALIGVTLVAFVLLYVNGDPTYVLLPPEASAEQRAAFRQTNGLDDPLPIQYVRFVGRALQGDLGRSFLSREPAVSMIARRLPATLLLALTAMAIALLVAVPCGVLAAYRRGSLFDRGLTLAVLFGQSMPTFWLGMIAILIVAVQLHLLPASGLGGPENLVLPACTLAAWLMALLARLTRSEMLESLGQDYVRTARAKGLSELAVVGHAFRNVLIPLVTLVGLQFGGLIGGAVMTETVFSWPGIGTLMLESILKRDHPVVLATLLYAALGVVLINFLTDLLYNLIDPRTHSGARARS